MIEDEKATNRINITPLVDVSLTLVLIFMVTMPLSTLYGISIKRNVLKKHGLTTPQENVVVHLTSNAIFIEDEQGTEKPIPYKEFGVVLRQMLQISETNDFYLKIDENVPHGQTVWAMDLAKQNGAKGLSILDGGS